MPAPLQPPDTAHRLAALVQRHEIYRIKGFVALPGAAMRLVVQGVGQRFDSHFDRPWGAHEERATRLVLIGDHLDGAALQAELQGDIAGMPERYLQAISKTGDPVGGYLFRCVKCGMHRLHTDCT